MSDSKQNVLGFLGLIAVAVLLPVAVITLLLSDEVQPHTYEKIEEWKTEIPGLERKISWALNDDNAISIYEYKAIRSEFKRLKSQVIKNRMIPSDNKAPKPWSTE